MTSARPDGGCSSQHPPLDAGDAGHFERVAATYEGARPPYPAALYDLLAARGVIGPGCRVLEIGAGTGEATTELLRSGARVTAVEPGPALAARLTRRCPEADVVQGLVEQVPLDDGAYDAVVAATSMHWVDLAVALPRLARAVRPCGHLAVWRTRFGSDVRTPFRVEVDDIVRRRPGHVDAPEPPPRPTPADLSAGGHFAPVLSREWAWSIDLDPDQLRRLFATFSNWSPAQVDAVHEAALRHGPRVTEHYSTVLHLLVRR